MAASAGRRTRHLGEKLRLKGDDERKKKVAKPHSLCWLGTTKNNQEPPGITQKSSQKLVRESDLLTQSLTDRSGAPKNTKSHRDENLKSHLVLAWWAGGKAGTCEKIISTFEFEPKKPEAREW